METKNNQNPQSASGREIKFRFWEYERKRMRKVNEMQLPNKTHHDLIVIMQYTGLKDKNGKEIYEGDIVGLPFVAPFGQIDDNYDPETVYKVVFEHGTFALKRPHDIVPLIDWCYTEVGPYVSNYGNKKVISDKLIGEAIGNIYENPDML